MREADNPTEPGAATAPQAQPATGAQQPPAPTVEYSVSGNLAATLARLNISVAFTSYQSGLLYCVGRNPKGGIHVHQAALPHPMGLSFDDGCLTMTGGYQILRFENVLEPNQRVNNTFDACYIPRSVHVTGSLDAHDVGVDKTGRPIFVNTRFNCLATISPRHSFEPLWKPPFVSAIIDEDRCHLNGLAMEEGEPRYVTAVSRSDTVDGWRDRRADGGVVVDVQTDEIICDGLSMPHSPRVHNGELWLFNSGTGELGVVDRAKGKFEPRVFCPGFTRGLSFCGSYAFVGLSKPRYKRFEGLALEQKLKDVDSEPWCGIQIIDTGSGTCVDWFRIDGNVAELYDLEVLPGVACPMAVPADSAEAAKLVTFSQ